MTATHTLSIESLAYGGDGIARLEDGRVAFVSAAAPGDVVVAEITEDRGSFVRVKVVEVLEPSPSRVEPPCPYFGVCGGCQWQHVHYTAQLKAKRAAVVDALTRIGKVEAAEELVAEIVASPREYGYRNKIELTARTTDSGLNLGFIGTDGETLVQVDACMLLPKRALGAPKALRGALRYLQGTDDLSIERVGIRVAQGTRDVEVALWTPPGGFPRVRAADLLSTAVKATSVVRVLGRTSRGRHVTSVEVLGGSGSWRERLAGFEYTVSAPSFFQVNTGAAELMVRAAGDLLEPGETSSFVDMYAGVGTFTLPLAAYAGMTTAIEAEGSSVRDLRRNLETAALWAEVLGGDAGRELPDVAHVDLVLVDPPRAGLSERALAALAATRAGRVAYVSCDPTTLARDLRRFADQGYRPRTIVPFDLFPQTWHVETVTLLEYLP